MRRGRRLDLLALDDHRAEVAADAAPLPPGVAPQLDGERVELAEVGRALDRRADQAERRRGVAVVHALAALVRLLLQHLAGPRHGPVSVIWVSKAAMPPTLRDPEPPAMGRGRRLGGRRARLVAEAAQGAGPLRPAVHARLADAEPLGGQGPGQLGSGRRAAPTRAACAAARRAGRASRRSAGARDGSGAARRRRRRGGPRRRRRRRGTPAGRSRRSSRRSSRPPCGSHAVEAADHARGRRRGGRRRRRPSRRGGR